MTTQQDISRGTPGLADYFLAGLPDRNFGLRVWNSVDEDKRSRYKKWVKFIKQHMEAIELMEKREKEKEIKKHICRGIKEMIKEEESKKRELGYRESTALKMKRVSSTYRGLWMRKMNMTKMSRAISKRMAGKTTVISQT